MEKGYSIVSSEGEIQFTFDGYTDEKAFRFDFNKALRHSGSKGGSISISVTLSELAVVETETVKLLTSTKFDIEKVVVKSGFELSLKSNKLLLSALVKVADYLIIGLVHNLKPKDLSSLEKGLLDKLDTGKESSSLTLDKDLESLFQNIDFVGLGVDLDRFNFKIKDVTEIVTQPIYSVKYQTNNIVKESSEALAYIGSEKQIYFVLGSLARFHQYHLKYNVDIFMKIMDTLMSKEVLNNKQGYQESIPIEEYEVGYVITRNKDGNHIALIISLDKNKSDEDLEETSYTALQKSSLFK